MDHKPFPLYMLGERYSVFLSDVGEQVLSKLYKERTDVVVRIKKPTIKRNVYLIIKRRFYLESASERVNRWEK